MSKQSWIILILLVILNVTGYVVMRSRSAAPPLAEVKANPALFSFNDYGDKVKLHARLSTLFPRGTHKQEIARYFADAGIKGREENYEMCSYEVTYGPASFIYERKSDALWAVQIGSWPSFVAPECNRGAPLTPTAPEKPRYLKMEELE